MVPPSDVKPKAANKTAHSVKSISRKTRDSMKKRADRVSPSFTLHG
ncbi:hypothetical protein BAT_3658 [Bacillus pumilus ATCC 7061]|nr:hypothetical protein BAT_3658 [Bacillus pumilus ATCC 7061]